MRNIRSFVLRAGRITKKQRLALAELLPVYKISLESLNLLDDSAFHLAFPRYADLIVEIGFGNGCALIKNARLHPERNFIGIEVYEPGIGSLLAALEQNSLNNLRVMVADAVLAIKKFPPACLSGVQIFFPDPWPKKRHHKRRLIQTEFISSVLKSLKVGGFIHCATDCMDYAEYMQAIFANFLCLEKICFDQAPSISRPITKFEERGRRLGNVICDLFYINTAK